MKTVLLISNSFSPVGGVGVQRNLKYVKYLPKFGWESIVLTIKYEYFLLQDNQLLKDIPQNTKIFRTSCIKPKQKNLSWTKINTDKKLNNGKIFSTLIHHILKFIENGFLIIDIWIGWIPFALFTGNKIIRRRKIDVILCSGGSFASFLIGYILSKKSKIPLVLDYRDGWTIDARRNTSKKYILKNTIDRILEIIILKHSTNIIFVSEQLLQLYSEKFSFINKKSHVITNGFDNEDFNFSCISQFNKNNKFIISHIGNCNIEERKSVLFTFLKAAKKIIKNNKELKIDLEIKLVGIVPEDVRKKINEYHLGQVVKIINFVPHNEAIKFMKKSNALLLLIENSPLNKTLLSGKLFEYFGAKKPIICFGPEDGAAGSAIKESQTGIVIDYKNEKIEEMSKKLSSFLENIMNDNFHIGNPDAIKKYERKEITSQLSNILNNTIKNIKNYPPNLTTFSCFLDFTAFLVSTTVLLFCAISL